MKKPIPDPEITAAMEAAGIGHEPGMAAELMAQIAPLLAAEGIDFNDPDLDLDKVNAALGRAVERHNLELFTPVGKQREQVIGVLARFSVALDGGRRDEAQAELDAIGPNPSATLPAASHVIGAGLGILDTWFGATEPPGVLLLPAGGIGRGAARDILKLARTRSCFASLDDLIRSHAGKAVFEGVALVVASYLSAAALQQGTDVATLAPSLLGSVIPEEGPSSRPLRPARRPRSMPRQLTSSEKRVRRDFRNWLATQDGDFAAPSLQVEIESFEQILLLARSFHLDLRLPIDVIDLTEMLLEDREDDDNVDYILDILDDYLHFRLSGKDDLEEWSEAHDRIEETIEPDDPFTHALTEALSSADELDPQEVREALATTTIVGKVPELLAWIGTRRAAAPSGGVRRADIEHVAGLLGVPAVGVNKLPRPWRRQPDEPVGLFVLEPDAVAPPAEPSEDTVYVLAMKDVPQLHAWWQALKVTHVIESAPSRISPGQEARRFQELVDDKLALPPLEVAEALAASYVSQIFINEIDQTSMGIYFTQPVISYALALLSAAVIPSVEEWPDDDEELGPDEEEFGSDLLMSIAEPAAHRLLGHLVQAGLLEVRPSGRYVAPAALRGVIARGILMTVGAMAGDE